MEKVRLVAVVELQGELVDIKRKPWLDESAYCRNARAIKLGPEHSWWLCVGECVYKFGLGAVCGGWGREAIAFYAAASWCLSQNSSPLCAKTGPI